jgi:hypothetical protein
MKHSKGYLLSSIVALISFSSEQDAKCAMCRRAAESTDWGATLKLGILVLLVPTVAIFVLFFVMVFRSENGER